MMLAHEICHAPTPCRPSNDSNFKKPLRAFTITCRFHDSTEVTIPSIAVNDTAAIGQLDEQLGHLVDGYTVVTRS